LLKKSVAAPEIVITAVAERRPESMSLRWNWIPAFELVKNRGSAG
jgi:hypothetical protein